MMNPFDWLRERVARAFVEGAAEGLERIEAGEVAGLQHRIALALEAPAASADPSPAAAGDTTATTARTGKRGAK
jgi:hypothetical protein